MAETSLNPTDAPDQDDSGPLPLRLAGITLTGVLIMALFFGAFGGWSALAPLDSAAVAQGVIKVAGDRKLVQHLEGGIVAEVGVADGDIARAGDVLLRLDDTQARSQLDLVMSRIVSREALAARLRAERDDVGEIEFNAASFGEAASSAARDALSAQADIFRARRRSLIEETGILSQRLRQTGNEVDGLEELIRIQNEQLAAIDAEAGELERLTKKGLTTRERQLGLRRQGREIQGERATNLAAVARAGSSVAEVEQQILNLRTIRLNEAVDGLGKVEAELFDLQQQRRSAEDILRRTAIVAPVDGVVMDLQVHTAGGVVRSGETLMTVVPLDQLLVVEAMVRPEDVETIAVGQAAHVRIPALSRYNLPPLEGSVTVVSADRLVEERTGAPYFTAIIVVDDGELGKLEGRKLVPGMTSEVMIRTGSRTMLAYLAEPLMQNFRRALREK